MLVVCLQDKILFSPKFMVFGHVPKFQFLIQVKYCVLADGV
jgi:hypothetical protein